jgi:hypothetical protein
MPRTSTAVDITLRQTLKLLDGPLASFAAAVCQGGYAFWLGSGISLGRVEGLKRLIPRVLEHLQQRVQAGDPNCRFRHLISEIMNLASLDEAERAATNVEQPIETWPRLSTMVDRLIAASSCHWLTGFFLVDFGVLLVVPPGFEQNKT